VTPERIVDLRTRTVVRLLAIAIAALVLVELVLAARRVLTWVAIALFLALALDPLVNLIQRRMRLKRAPAIVVAYVLLLLVTVGIGWSFVPKLTDEVNGFAHALPGYVHDVTHGRGRLGFLETKYHVVEKVREQVNKGGASRLLGLSGTVLSITKSVIAIITATVTIVFLTFFMLLEGRSWAERGYALFPEHAQARVRRVGHDIYRTVGGYVTGNILISVIAGVSAAVVLLIVGVPYAVALGLVVAIFDLIPLAGATIAGIVVVTVAFLHSVPAGIVAAVFIIVYQQVENHFLQPVVYGRTVQLSPLVVLIAVLVGAELSGVVGALAAIPVAGAVQVVVRDQLSARGKLNRAAGRP
jgi:predicted PurR-regulated permease PerM